MMYDVGDVNVFVCDGNKRDVCCLSDAYAGIAYTYQKDGSVWRTDVIV